MNRTPHDSAADGTTERACYLGGRHNGAWEAALGRTENRAISCQNVPNVSFAAEKRGPPNADLSQMWPEAVQYQDFLTC